MRSSIIKFEYNFDPVTDRITGEGGYLVSLLESFVEVVFPDMVISNNRPYFMSICNDCKGAKHCMCGDDVGWIVRYPYSRFDNVDYKELLRDKRRLKGTHEINTKFKPHTVGTMAVLLVLYDMKIIKNLRCEGAEDKWMEARELVRNYFGPDWLKSTR